MTPVVGFIPHRPGPDLDIAPENTTKMHKTTEYLPSQSSLSLLNSLRMSLKAHDRHILGKRESTTTKWPDDQQPLTSARPQHRLGGNVSSSQGRQLRCFDLDGGLQDVCAACS